jgi:hypothetical protein
MITFHFISCCLCTENPSPGRGLLDAQIRARYQNNNVEINQHKSANNANAPGLGLEKNTRETAAKIGRKIFFIEIH